MTASLIKEDALHVLDVGSGVSAVAEKFFPNSVIHRLDADPDLVPETVHDITQPLPEQLHGIFDLVYCSHVLEHIGWREVVPTLINLRAALKVGGELWLIVPSLEWAANEILKDRPSPALQAFIYGSEANEWQHHKSGYTLMFLRQVCQLAGMVARQAYQGDFQIELTTPQGDTKLFPAKQNILVAMKHKE